MNGYLNNLAIRTLNAGNLVEPRMLSIFEPQSGAESRVESPAGANASERASLPRPVIETYADPRPAAMNPKHESASRAEPPAIVTDGVADFAEARPVSTQPPDATYVAASLAHSQANTSQPEFEPTVGNSPIERIVETTMVEPTMVEPTIAEPTIVEPTNRLVESTRRIREPAVHVVETASQINERVETMPASPSSPSPAPLPRAAAFPGISPKKSAHAELIESPTSESVKSSPEETVATPATLKVSGGIVESASATRTALRSITRAATSYARRERFTPEDQPQPERSINITIGRVEVRATPLKTSTSKTARSESPVMPLEEYLRKQRRGDSR